jgi:hypothetical protein
MPNKSVIIMIHYRHKPSDLIQEVSTHTHWSLVTCVWVRA